MGGLIRAAAENPVARQSGARQRYAGSTDLMRYS
jgi:hypothetical protein